MTPSSPYRRGYEFELRVKKALEKRGWVVWRSAGSHSPVDLVVAKRREWWLVQCKADGDIRPADRVTLGNLVMALFCRGAIAYRWSKALRFREITHDGEELHCYFPGPLPKEEEN